MAKSEYFIRRLFISFALASSMMAAAASAAPFPETEVRKGLVKVVFYKDNETRTATGFVAASEYVVTAYGLTKWAERISIVNLATNAEIVAQKSSGDEAVGLALLKVDGLQVKPMIISESDAHLNIREEHLIYVVSLLNAEEVKTGLIFGEDQRNQSVKLIKHNALIKKQDFGTPLFNRCGQVVGVNRPDQIAQSLWTGWSFPGDPEKNTVFAVRADALIQFLKRYLMPKNISINTTDAICLTATQQAKKEEEKAKAAKSAAEAKVAREKEKAAAAEAKAEEEKRKAAAAQAKAAATEAQAQEQQEFFIRIATISGLVLLFVGALIWFRFRRKSMSLRQAKAEAQRAAAPPLGAVDILFEGRDANGKVHTLKIPAISLDPDKGGAVVGRNPSQSGFILDLADVSREHFRIYVQNEQILIEDLGSTNGTQLNGQKLAAHETVILNTQDRINIGSIAFNVVFL